MAKLLPIEKLALEVGGLGVLALLAFFYHPIAFSVVFYLLGAKMHLFMFVHSNTKDVKNDDEPNQYSEGYLPGMGSDWERSVRTNLSEGNAGRRIGDVE
jgi:hypothetical protein